MIAAALDGVGFGNSTGRSTVVGTAPVTAGTAARTCAADGARPDCDCPVDTCAARPAALPVALCGNAAFRNGFTNGAGP
ncbi:MULTISPECIES: hypothetical protein, partial [unclassified Frankia]|uniref:hypothetical protein n=1 Tax=unclassified Frankia TaxID=2632575 RepID=UPI002AD2F3DF